jgi:hypothetical protein
MHEDEPPRVFGEGTIHDYFRKAMHSPRTAAREDGSGPVVSGPDGLCAAFDLEIEQPSIVRASYRCTTCVTLVALCEHLAELAAGRTVEDALGLDPEILLRFHPEVPVERRDRAALASTALRMAIQYAIERNST